MADDTIAELSAITVPDEEMDVSAHEEVQTASHCDTPKTSTPYKPQPFSSTQKATGMKLCHVCGQQFKHERHLNDHKKVKHNHGNVRYNCTVCKYKTMQKDAFLGHMNIHNNIKPYKCRKCPKSFAYRQSLIAHKCTHSEKVFCCDVCGKQFSNQSHLTEHSWVHKDEYRYRCETCNTPFKYRSSLKKHKDKQSH
jgi:hypothetical protein